MAVCFTGRRRRELSLRISGSHRYLISPDANFCPDDRMQAESIGVIRTQGVAMNEMDKFWEDCQVSEEGLIPAVDPSDLKNVWKKQIELVAAVGGTEFSLMFARRKQT